jgi:hypothetical protein
MPNDLITVSKVPYLLTPEHKDVRHYPMVPAMTVADAVAPSIAELSDKGFKDFVVLVNGRRARDLTAPVKPGDFISVSVYHGEAGSLTALVWSALYAAGMYAGINTAAYVISYVIATAVMVGVGMMINTFLAPPTPDDPSQSGNQSTSYTFGAKNPVTAGNPVPVIYGEVMQVPSVLGSYRKLKWNAGIQPYGGWDTWQYFMLALSAGETNNPIVIGKVRAGEELVSSYESAEWSVTSGALLPTGADAAKILAAEFHYTYHDRAFEKKVEHVQAQYYLDDPNAFYTTTNGMADAVAVTITFPKGLYWIDSNGITRWVSSKNGGVYFYISAIDSDNVEGGTWIVRADADKIQQHIEQYWVYLPKRDIWTIVVRRSTADDYNAPTVKERLCTESVVTGFLEVLATGQTYPGIQIGLLGVKATENVSGNLGTITVEHTRTSISCRNWADTANDLSLDPQNPANAAYDMYTNKYNGRGISPTKMSQSLWTEWYTWCNEQIYDRDGIAHYRCRCNVVLETRASLADQIKHIEDVGRARIVRLGDTWYPIIDKPRTASYTFSSGNMLPGSFQWESYEDPEKVDAVDVVFWDKARKFKKNTVRAKASWFETLAYPPNIASVQLRACNDKDEALRHAVFRMQKTEMITRHGVFKSGLDAVQIELGEVVNIIHPTNTYGFGGKLARDHTAATTIYLDQIINMPRADYHNKATLYTIDPDGTYAEHTITGPFDVDTQTITISGSTYTGSQFDTFSIGRPNDEKLLYQITKKKFVPASGDDEAESIEFTFTEYVEDMFYYRIDGVGQYFTSAALTTEAPI